MSYAIIRNQRYTSGNLNYLYRHNERKNTNYSNKDINKNSIIKNYSLKNCNTTYLNRFNQLKEEYNLKGQIKKTSNIACEYIITSDKDYFDSIGLDETKRFFETAYKFVASYKNLGEQFIISAKIHMDEKTPHMHLVFIPVIHKLNTNSGQIEDKICCSEFWKGKDSYKILQDNFYRYMTRAGFNLERGKEDKERNHIQTNDYKELINYEVKELFEESKHLEKEVITNDLNILRENYKRVIKKFNTIAKRYTSIHGIVENILEKNRKLFKDNQELIQKNSELEQENNLLKEYNETTKTWISTLLNWPLERIERILLEFYQKYKE